MPDDNKVKIRVGANLEDIEAAVDAFAARMKSSFTPAEAGAEAASRSVEKLDRGILNAHQSTHLLAEEFGVHLPRSVVGAISEALPAIEMLGPALLGVFALKEVPELVNGIKEAVQSWEGFGKAEQEAMRKAIADTVTLHAKVIDVERELDLFGKKESEQAALHAKWAAEDSDKALTSLLSAEGKVKDIQAQIAEAKKGAALAKARGSIS